jgi:hypothetical protein
MSCNDGGSGVDTQPICEACIWHHDHEGLVRTGPCDPASWAGSVQQELLKNTIYADLTAEAGPFPAFPHCAAVTMVKDEADIIYANLRWLHHVGARRFVVMDNMSADGTWAEVMRFDMDHPDAEVLLLRDPVVPHYQSEKVSAMMQLALQRWPDVAWVLPVDADEFCVAKHGLRALAYVPAHVQAVTVPKVIHFLGRGQAEPQGERIDFAKMDVRSSLFCVPPKVIARAAPNLRISQGNHKVFAAGEERVRYTGGFQYGFFHREFQTRSFAQFRRKVVNGGAAILAARDNGRDVGGEHWMGWHATLREHGDAGLWKVYLEQCFREPGGGYVRDCWRGDGLF